jgi:hypothetical protein
MNIESTVIIKYHPDMPAWQAEYVGERGKIIAQKTLAGVFHWLVNVGGGAILEYRPHELQEAQEPEEAAA